MKQYHNDMSICGKRRAPFFICIHSGLIWGKVKTCLQEIRKCFTSSIFSISVYTRLYRVVGFVIIWRFFRNSLEAEWIACNHIGAISAVVLIWGQIWASQISMPPWAWSFHALLDFSNAECSNISVSQFNIFTQLFHTVGQVFAQFALTDDKIDKWQSVFSRRLQRGACVRPKSASSNACWL